MASRGWQKASKKALEGGHAEHIHANCGCEYAIRFNSRTTVAGYDPDKYLRQYENAGGDINAMRRERYAANKDAINAQKRAAYAARQYRTAGEKLRLPQVASNIVMQKVEKGEYSLHLGHQQYDKHCAGTSKYDDYAASRVAADRDPQSMLNVSFEEAQKIIDYSGTGIIRVNRNGTATGVEFVTCKTTVGEYFENGEWHKTKRVAIHHGKKGSHIVPVKEDSYV